MPVVSASSHSMSVIPPHSFNNTDAGCAAPPPRLTTADDGSWHARRLFLGPMPIKVAAPVAERHSDRKHKHWWLTVHARGQNDDGEGDETEVPEGHAFRYFLERGGREEEWENHENLRKRTKQEMLLRWKRSGWDSVTHLQNKNIRQRNKWVGQTFQIGVDFLGVPMQTAEDVMSAKSLKSLDPAPSLEPSTSRIYSAESYQIAREIPSESLVEGSAVSSSSDPNHRTSRYTNGSGVALLPKDESPRRSSTLPFSRLLSVPSIGGRAMTDGQIRAPKVFPTSGVIMHTASDAYLSAASGSIPLRSALRPLQDDDIKGKSVQFSPAPQHHEQPAPPSEVLARRPSTIPETRDSAVVAQRGVRYGDVFLSDRMLVRRSHVKSGIVRPHFDAEAAMKMRDFRSWDWREFLVIWRKDMLELYEEYSIPWKEMVLGHKRLAFTIPLRKPDTKLSLYSFTDLTFCLTCTGLHVVKDDTRRTSSHSGRIHFHRHRGTDIFVFKGKTRSRSIDWMWNIWQWMEDSIPSSFDVYCPATETRVRLQIPEFDQSGGEGYKTFTRDYVVEQCRAALKHLPSWDYLIERPLNKGAHLELCWRKQATLDWVRWKTDSNGDTRYWDVLYGLCLAKPHEITHLEIRIAEHRPTTVTLKDGTHLREPPAVEGYLYRIKANVSQTRARIYVSTHSGCLFLINADRAQPPRPPIPLEGNTEATVEDNEASLSFQELEVKRGTRQILQANVFIGLRSIVAVRRAFQVSVPSQHDNNEAQGRDQPDLEWTAEDGEDEGGDEVLSRHPDKPKLKVRRSFELLMRTGDVVRFEAYSCAVALEWITHLNHLVEYWKHRHRVDAHQEMDLIHCVTGDPLMLARPDGEPFHERPRDHDQSCEYLPSFWNWCVLDGCLPMIKNGRLFLRRGFRGQYRLMQLVLVSGHLIQFKCTHGIAHHLHSKTTSLLDAYVCSGHFAIQALPAEEFLANSDPLMRRFQDGLENDDPESDKVFLIWYRPHAIGKAYAQSELSKNSSGPAISPMNSKRKVLVLKARSKLERNAWCWALNGEIERISRR